MQQCCGHVGEYTLSSDTKYCDSEKQSTPNYGDNLWPYALVTLAVSEEFCAHMLFFAQNCFRASWAIRVIMACGAIRT